MTDKKKQSAVIAVATVLTVTSVLSPVATVYAADTETAIAQQTESTEIKENAPPITLPQELVGNEGQALQDIVLPEEWSWMDETTIISKDKTEYSARITVDDTAYDYSMVDGYNADGHFVVCNLSIEIKEQEPVIENMESEPQVTTFSTDVGKNSLSTPKTGDIEINDTNFPDEAFRTWLGQQSYGADRTITQAEIAGITKIDVGSNTNIKDLKGIEHFTALTDLQCYLTGITSLDVSNNTALSKLNCSGNANLTNLTVDGATSLTTLACSTTGITDLDVSNNTNLTSLNCGNTGISDLNVSNNTNLTDLNCYGNANLTNLTVDGATSLTKLDCYKTGITDLDISNNTNLTDLKCYGNANLTNLTVDGATSLTNLSCYNTEIEDLDVSNNTALTHLYCYNTGITSLDVSNNTALTYLYCYNTGITSLDVSNNTYLTYLNCDNTGISSLDVSNNTALISLNCNNTGISSLDVSNNTYLMSLNCNNTGITSLDVSNNTALISLYCNNTGISSLDVSNNTYLSRLDCSNTALAYLNIGRKSGITVRVDGLKPVNVEVTGESFKMIDKFAGIEEGRISNVSGAGYENGFLSNYRLGTPITYTYDYGEVANGTQTIDVTLNLIAKSTISITEDLNKAYDRNAVNATPSVYRAGSSGAISYKWEQKNSNNNWEDIVSAPADAGTYRVTAMLAPDSNFPDATSEPVEFTITQADSTIVVSANLDKTYDGTVVSVIPSVTKTGSNGKVSFKWEKKVNDTDWEDIASAPTDAGTYRVTAILASDSNYMGATSEPKEFTISQADSTISVTEELNKTYDNNSVNATPAVNTTGSSSAVSFKWEKKVDDTQWEEITSAPTDAGTYRVTATLAANSNYKGAISEPKEFTISQADSTISVTEELNKIYDKNSVNATPAVSITGSNGAVSFKWEKKVNDTNWEEITSAPTDAGIYRVTATLVSDKNYKEATSTPVEFTISQANSTISITEDLSKAFDGKTVNTTPTVNKTGSSGAVSYKWERKMNATEWENISSAPTDAGTYRVTAKIDADDNYKGEISDTKEFTIVQASNSWIDNLTITGWTYGDKAVSPSAKANFGTVVFTYSDSKGGAYTDTVPTNAGTWYVKATVADSENYNGLESIISFTISSKSAENNNQIVIPDINSDKDVENLVIKDGDKELIEGNDYDVEKKQDNNKVTVTITFKGNYAGTVIKTYIVEDKKPSVNPDTNKPSDSTKNDKTPAVETGDTATTGIWAMLAALSAGTLALMKGKKRKEKTEE